MAEKSSGNFKRLLMNLLAMGLVASIAVYVLFAWMDSYTNHQESVTVPQLKGMDYQEAIRILETMGLQAQVTDSDYVKTQVPGAVLELTPQQDQQVKRGRVIYLTINTLSVPLLQVPDVVDNSSLRQAEARLLASGFRLQEPEMVSGEKDWVYGVKYRGRLLGHGEKVPSGSSLTLLIGYGGAMSDSLDIKDEGQMMLKSDREQTDRNSQEQPREEKSVPRSQEDWF